MEELKEFIQKYVSQIEAFLTSQLLEETNVEITASDNVSVDHFLEGSKKKDIYICTKDKTLQQDIIIILDEEWYGLLSSIMLGVEEKSNNEITRDLLKKFSDNFIASLKPKLEGDGLQINLAEVRIFTKTQLSKELNHSEYFHVKMNVDGLADDSVRAEILCGNPEFLLKKKDENEKKKDSVQPSIDSKTKIDSSDDGDKFGDQDTFVKVDAEELEQLGTSEEVISARGVEFEEFLEQPETAKNGDSRSMDLLKDVEMDISVELGRIELPLGKLLELAKGSVIELEKLAGEPVDILVNGHYIAKGEVVVIDEHFGVRISSLVTTRQRLAGLK